jgi:hypothetical protein
MEIKTNFTTPPLSLAREENPVVYKESIRGTKFEMSLTVIRTSGYQVVGIRVSGQQAQEAFHFWYS